LLANLKSVDAAAIESERILFEDISDEQLLGRAREGEEAAFRVLYERHRTPLFRFAYRLLGSVESAEDATHDCFLSLLRDSTKFDAARANLRTYLFAAVRNQSLKRLAMRGEEVLIDDERIEATGAGRTPEPLRHVLAAEVGREVRRAIGELPALQREAILLFEYEELSLAEIAEVTGSDVGTIKSRLHRARISLRKALEAFVADADVVSVGGEH